MTNLINSQESYCFSYPLCQWLKTEAGDNVLSWAQIKVDQMVSNIFGFYALQIGLENHNLLHNNRMRNRLILTSTFNKSQFEELKTVQGFPEQIPYEDESLDLIVLPFTLNYREDPFLVLREVNRVLVSEGKILILGFNPYSLWGLKNTLPGKNYTPDFFINKTPLSLLKQWLEELSFETERGAFGCYEPACQTTKWLQRWQFMNKAGNRWWPANGAIYTLVATKKTIGMHLIQPAWKNAKASKSKQGVSVSNSINQYE